MHEMQLMPCAVTYFKIIFDEYNQQQIFDMNNIQIKRGKIKRSIESIIDESALDHQYNFQAQELRRAYNNNIKDLNTRIKEHEREIDQLSLKLSQKQEIIGELQDKNHQIFMDLEKYQEQNTELKKNNLAMKKRLQHLQYKIESIQSNRNTVVAEVEQDSFQEDSIDKINEIKKGAKKEAYDEINQIMNRKISKFTKQMKNYSISLEIQRNIETFLQQILYINPHSIKHIPFAAKNPAVNRKVGLISDRKPALNNNTSEKFSDLEEWQKLQKSLEKLKNIRKSPPQVNSRRTPRKASGKIVNHDVSAQKIKKKLVYH